MHKDIQTLVVALLPYTAANLNRQEQCEVRRPAQGHFDRWAGKAETEPVTFSLTSLHVESKPLQG